jgi:hypothetical protein
MELTTFLDAARANDDTAKAIMLVTDFGAQSEAAQHELIQTLKNKGFMELTSPGSQETALADTLAVIQATFKRSVTFAARAAARIIGLEIIEVNHNDLMIGLNRYEDCTQIVNTENFISAGTMLRELLAGVAREPQNLQYNGPTREECQSAPKIVLDVHLPDGEAQMNICTACAMHFIRTGEGAELWMHPKKVRMLLSAVINLMSQIDTQEVSIPRDKLN